METGRYKPLIDTNGTLTNYNYERDGRKFAAVRAARTNVGQQPKDKASGLAFRLQSDCRSL